MIIHRVIDRLWFSQQEPPIDQEVLWLSRVSEGYELKVYDDGDWRVINWPGDIFVDIEIDENGDLIINGEVVGHVTGEDGQDGQNGVDGQDGHDGQDATIENVTATVGSSTGAPSVQVTMGGTPSHRTIHFAFDGLKGAQGLPGQNGQNGTQGPQGEPGQNGQDGQDGRDGTMWYTGTELTQPGTFIIPDSNIGDLYFNTSTYDLYQQVSANQWIWLCNLQGPPGPGGGGSGHDGSTWYFGNDITGTGAISYYIQGAQVGDLYLNVDTLELYQAQSGNVWQYICTLGNVYTAGEGIDITNKVISNILAQNDYIGGVKADTHDSDQEAIYGIQVKFGCDGIYDVEDPEHLIDEEHLCITSEQLYKIWKNLGEFPVGAESGLYGRFVNIGTEAHPEYIPTLGINGVVAENVGKFPTVIPSQSSQTGFDIEWVEISPVVGTYEVLGPSTVAGTECVVEAPLDKYKTFLRGDGRFVEIETGDSFDIEPLQHSGTPIANYTLNGISGTLWAPSSRYYEGPGIDIDQNNYISIDTSQANPGEVLGYNGNGIAWVPQTNYTPGKGIAIQNNEIHARITEWEDEIPTAQSSVEFRAAGSGQAIRVGITLFTDNQVVSTLSQYTYTRITLAPNGTAGQIIFNIQDQPELLYGDPVYVLLEVGGKHSGIEVIVNTEDYDGRGLINVNEAVVHDANEDKSYLNLRGLSTGRFLITMQFGIAKIEYMEATLNGDNNGGGGGNVEEPAS